MLRGAVATAHSRANAPPYDAHNTTRAVGAFPTIRVSVRSTKRGTHAVFGGPQIEHYNPRRRRSNGRQRPNFRAGATADCEYMRAAIEATRRSGLTYGGVVGKSHNAADRDTRSVSAE